MLTYSMSHACHAFCSSREITREARVSWSAMQLQLPLCDFFCVGQTTFAASNCTARVLLLLMICRPLPLKPFAALGSTRGKSLALVVTLQTMQVSSLTRPPSVGTSLRHLHEHSQVGRSHRSLFHTSILLGEASFMHLVLLVGRCHWHEHVPCNSM